MKVIVISGASSRVGKTTLALALQRVLPDSEVVKIGHGPRKDRMGNHFYELGTSLETVQKNHAQARWLLVESNSVLREIQPDLIIYLEGPHPKPSAAEARRRADLVSGREVSDEEAARLAARLDITPDLMRTILRLIPGASGPIR